MPLSHANKCIDHRFNRKRDRLVLFWKSRFLAAQFQPRYWLNIFIFHLNLTVPGIATSSLASLDASGTARALFIDLWHKARFHHRSRVKASRHPALSLSCSTKFSSVLLPLSLETSFHLSFPSPSSRQSLIFSLIRRLSFLLVKLTTRFPLPDQPHIPPCHVSPYHRAIDLTVAARIALRDHASHTAGLCRIVISYILITPSPIH